MALDYMEVKLNLPDHVIAAQMGWSDAAVEKMVATHAHTEIGALDVIDAAFATVPDTTRPRLSTIPRISKRLTTVLHTFRLARAAKPRVVK
jgi:hypothetical protein